MKKYVRDPSINTNQTNGTSSTSNGRFVSQTDNTRGGSNAQNMADSYAKRQMFYYGVDENHFNSGSNIIQTT